MNPGGNLRVRARLVDGGLEAIDVRLERPPVTRLFIGQVPAAVAQGVPLLYSLCARAQGAAAQAALATAEGRALPPRHSTELWLECLHEHLWRLLLDWPAALGLAQARDAYILWRSRRDHEPVAATRRLLASTLFGAPERTWVEGEPPCPGSLARACQERLPGGEPSFLDVPDLTPEEWLAYWQGRRSTAPLPTLPAAVGTAYRGRLQAVRLALQALTEEIPYPVAVAGGDGWGVGQALTARGVLTHAVRLEEGKVKAYRIWAPTDCHFVDARGLTQMLADSLWETHEAARQGLERAILALDPCLPYEIELEH